MNRTRAEMADEIRNTFFRVFGGPDKMDCWLSRVADEMAKAKPWGVVSQLPPHFQNLLSEPKAILDSLIDRLHELRVWEYELRKENGLLKIFDRTSGHLIEEGSAEQMEALRAKYRANLKNNDNGRGELE